MRCLVFNYVSPARRTWRDELGDESLVIEQRFHLSGLFLNLGGREVI